MRAARPQYASKLDFVVVEDFTQIGVFDSVMDGIDAVIHVASVGNSQFLVSSQLNVLTPLTALLLRHHQQRAGIDFTRYQRSQVDSFRLRQAGIKSPASCNDILLRLSDRPEQHPGTRIYVYRRRLEPADIRRGN